MQNPACVTVQVVLVALIVKVSGLKKSCLNYVIFIRLHNMFRVKALWLYSYNVIYFSGYEPYAKCAY